MCIIFTFRVIDSLLVQFINPYLVITMEDPPTVKYHTHMGDLPLSILKECQVTSPDLMHEIDV